MSNQLTSLQRQLAQRDTLIRELEFERRPSFDTFIPENSNQPPHVHEEKVNIPPAQVKKKQDVIQFMKSKGERLFV
jgi:hypothetical protein